MSSMAPYTFTDEQVQQYLKRIRLPEYLRQTKASGNASDDLKFLAQLQQHHLVAVPFENCSLHYGPGKVSLHPDTLFQKVIGPSRRGGYCMENNLLFSTLLRSLGFTLYSAGARVAQGPQGFSGFGHMINLVTIDGQKYHVDVGFGANGPIVPLKLNKNGDESSGITPASHRLMWKNISQNTDPNQRLWILQHRNDATSGWQDVYCYSETEFLAADYEVMNYYTSTSPRTFFTNQVVAVRMIWGSETGLTSEAGVIVGTYIIQKETFKIRVHGKSKTLQDFKSDVERVSALTDHYEMQFTEGEKAAIKGLPSAIGNGGPEM